MAVPWRRVFTSKPYISLVLTDIGNCWGLYLFYTQGPTYLKFMLGYSMTKTGLLNTVPMLSR